MSVIFQPSGVLDIATDPSDLPETADQFNISSNALVRSKNLRRTQAGKAVTRDGSAKINTSAISDVEINWIQVMDSNRYAFAGTNIYENESSIASGLTDAQWTAIQYNAYNDTTNNLFCTNGTDKKRVEGGTVYEWGVDAPTDTPTMSAGIATSGDGLTGYYNVRHAYVRKVSGATVYVSNPGPYDITSPIYLSGESLLVDVNVPADASVTHIRLFRTANNGSVFYWDQDIPVNTYAYGYSEDFEESDGYISGDGFKFTKTSSAGTENTFTWEETFATTEDTDTGETSNEWYQENDDLLLQWWDAIK